MLASMVSRGESRTDRLAKSRILLASERTGPSTAPFSFTVPPRALESTAALLMLTS